MKSFWLWTCSLGACPIAVVDNLWGWRVLERVSRWLFMNSKSLYPLSFVSPLPDLPSVAAQCWYASGSTLAFQSPQVNYKYILLGCLCCDAIKMLVELFDLFALMVRLVHSPEWLRCCVVSLKSRWIWAAGNGSAAYATTYNFFLYNECHPILLY